VPKFFAAEPVVDAGGPRKLPRYDTPRAMVGAGQKLNLGKQGEVLDKRPTSEWQIAAWRFFEQVGEIHYAFNLVGQICSRVRLFPAVVAAANEEPVHVDTWLESLGDKGNTETSREVSDKAKGLVEDLTENTPGRTSGLMRTMAMNFSVPGEVYLAQDAEHKTWLCLSSEELTSQGKKWRIRRNRSGSAGSTGAQQGKKDLILPGDAWMARLWRAHPRFGDEPDSSMLGVLDQCEQLVLLDQAMRNMARRAMNAGVVFVPDGITAYSSDGKAESVADAIAYSALQAVESEAALSTVTPKTLTGPLELGGGIKFIPLTQATDPNLATAAQKLLERILIGIDIPKDVVKGLADVKFANAIVIDDDLYRAHIEPLVLLIVDTLTEVYLRPLLLKGLDESSRKIAERIVMWADTSSIVTRPDKSQAANEGYDKRLLSGEAWRRARGFSETDKPDEDELLIRLAVERAPIPPEIASTILTAINPGFFEKAAAENSTEAGIPNDVSELLSGTPPGGAGAPQEPSALERAGGPLNGGQVTPGGNLPPKQPVAATPAR
jgi:hypothetical protein